MLKFRLTFNIHGTHMSLNGEIRFECSSHDKVRAKAQKIMDNLMVSTHGPGAPAVHWVAGEINHPDVTARLLQEVMSPKWAPYRG